MDDLQKKAALARAWSIRSTTASASGHPTSCMSAADVMTVLFDKHFAYDLKNPHNPNNDRLIFSKGHAAPLFYTLYALAGAFDPKELLTLRKFGSRLEGHPTPEFPYTDAATGSLGQGLSVGAGLAYIGKAENRSHKTYVLLGDGEMAEGSVWEAANFAAYYKLNNLVAIVDVNRFGQSQETMFGVHSEEYSKKFSAFGFEVFDIDGHDMKEIISTFKKVVENKSDKPVAIVARTKKGKGVSFLEDKDNWHGKAVKKEELEKALAELGDLDEALRFTLKTPEKTKASSKKSTSAPLKLSYKKGDEIATREVYGDILAQLGSSDESMYVLDGDTKNSTFSEGFKKVHPDRFIECFIAEQNMVGVALGLSRLGKKPWVSTFSAFFTRAFDQVRMAALSNATIHLTGSHCGVSIGEDGSSQMGLEDIAMFGSIFNSVVLHPSDAMSTARLIEEINNHTGISYLRTLRPKTPVLYSDKEKFQIGGSKVLRKSADDVLTVVGMGITVHEALKAADTLAKSGISIRVIDAYSLKPIDKKTLVKAVSETEKPTIITVEDHYSHGGLGDFVLDALAETGAQVVKMAVLKTPRSGVKDELLAYEEIDASAIVKKVKKHIRS